MRNEWCWEDFLKKVPKSIISWAKNILCSKWSEFEDCFK